MYNDPVKDLIHLYEDGAIKRRALIKGLAKYTGSLAAAMATLESVGLAQAPAVCVANARVAEDDPSIYAEDLTLFNAGPLFVYQARPADFSAGPRPAVLVVHENQGLTEHIKDVTRRVAKAGFVGIGIDLLSRQGGTPQFTTGQAAQQAYNRTRPEERLDDMRAALLTIRDQPYVRGDRLGAVGFCAGGENVYNLATNSPELSAAAVFYGQPPSPVDQLSRMTARFLGIFPELDRSTTSPLPNVLSTFLANNKRYELYIYANTNHAFHNDTGARYDQAAACDAWAKTTAFFARVLNA